MQVLCALASASAAQLSMNSRSTVLSLLWKLPSRNCKSAVKYTDMKVAQISHLSQSCCPLLQTSFRKTVLRSNPSTLHRLHHSVQKQPLNRKLGFGGTSKGILIRVRVIGPSSTGSIVRRRLISGDARDKDSYHRRTGLIYVCAAGIFMLGMSYAGVPLYRMLCQATGLGGTVSRGHDTSKIESMQPVPERVIRIRFNADVGSSMRWNFKPQQTEVKVLPGETALAFYTARNPTDKPIIGISTYNVVPFEAGQYFNKIQCFCFEEQRLNPHEQVDMPVFFYIDPEFAEDPKLTGVETITLSYTFFEAKEGFQVPLPGYMTQAQ